MYSVPVPTCSRCPLTHVHTTQAHVEVLLDRMQANTHTHTHTHNTTHTHTHIHTQHTHTQHTHNTTHTTHHTHTNILTHTTHKCMCSKYAPTYTFKTDTHACTHIQTPNTNRPVARWTHSSCPRRSHRRNSTGALRVGSEDRRSCSPPLPAGKTCMRPRSAAGGASRVRSVP